MPTDSFDAAFTLLSQCLDKRPAIADAIEDRLLNVRAFETARGRGRAHVERQLEECFLRQSPFPRGTNPLKALAEAHLADGFALVLLDGFSHQLSPVELIGRAYLHWNQQRWPGRSGRVAYAHVVYAAFVLRQLEYLSLRIWDDPQPAPDHRLSAIQRLLDDLNRGPSSLTFVRNALWLMHTAQGPLTKHLDPYFAVAGRIASSFSAGQRQQIHAAGAKLAGGHLRSQLRYRIWASGKAIDHPDNLAVTRNSNSMDTALLVGDLVPLLRAYRTASESAPAAERAELADAILQGLSADPELLLSRLDLLRPCTMIESLFIDTNDGRAGFTALGQTHADLLDEYSRLIGDAAAGLRVDAAAFNPDRRVYSPYGIVYGFIADVLSNIALARLPSHSTPAAGVEEMFNTFADPGVNLALANQWERLPRLGTEREHFEHSPEWAGQIFDRLTRALDHRAASPKAVNASPLPNAHLYVRASSDLSIGAGVVPDGAVLADEHCFTSDLSRTGSSTITPWPRSQILSDRNEGRFLASAEHDGQWFAVSKVILTVCLAHGRHAVITGIPAGVADVLRLTCGGLVEPSR